jgi:hypothetical protein
MVSCRPPAFPKIVIFTPSKSVAFNPLKSIDFEASTVKIVRFCSTFEKVNKLDCRSTLTAGAGGAFLLSTSRVHPRFRYTPTVSVASSSAAAALHRAYFAASLFLMTFS